MKASGTGDYLLGVYKLWIQFLNSFSSAEIIYFNFILNECDSLCSLRKWYILLVFKFMYLESFVVSPYLFFVCRVCSDSLCLSPNIDHLYFHSFFFLSLIIGLLIYSTFKQSVRCFIDFPFCISVSTFMDFCFYLYFLSSACFEYFFFFAFF